MNKKTLQQFIIEAKNIYGDLYDYSKVEYKNTMTKITIICKVHGEWEVTPDNHLTKNSGCPKCRGFKLSKEEKIDLANRVHNYKYDYSLIKDKNILNQKSYPILCLEHGEFIQTWNNHYNMGQKCPQCSIYGRPKILKEGEKSWSSKYTQEYMMEYYQNNKLELKSKQKIRYNHRRKNDINFKILLNLRIRINQALKKFNYYKKNTSIKELGCSIKEYVIYLEERFDENMNWGNYGSFWEIDHIHPLSKGGSFHYTNTQPLTISENRKKGNKL